jgi:hypothetical protein
LQTGIFLCGEAGLLKGRQVCGPRAVQDIIKTKYGKDIVQRGHELRWVQDGNFWSSGELALLCPLSPLPLWTCFFQYHQCFLIGKTTAGHCNSSQCASGFSSTNSTKQAECVYHDFKLTSARYIGGITNGNDLVAAYARHKSEFFPRPLADFGCDMVDVGDRPQMYEKSQVRFFAGFGINLLKAWVLGFWRK